MKRTALCRKTPLESEIQRAICDYLAYRKVFFWRQNTAPTFDRATQSYRAMPTYAMRGVPDIIVIKAGQFIGLEVKADRGRLSADQMTFSDCARRAGAQYHVVRSIDDVQRIGL
jgi:hypothetical protein